MSLHSSEHTAGDPLSLENKEKDKDLPRQEVPNLPKNDDPASPEQDRGVTRIEALYLVFGKGWKIYFLWGSIGLIAFVYSLASMTTYTYLAFATSAFSTHALLGTISVITSIMASVTQPFIAKVADLTSRPWAIAFSILFYCLGYIVVAASKSVQDVAGGEVLYTIGNTGISLLTTILIGDITNLQNRGLANGLFSAPYIVTCFIAGYISDGISAYSENGWRWGYGMFVILMPVCISPALFVLFWADRRATKIGALSLASSSEARRKVLEGAGAEPPLSIVQKGLKVARQIDLIGLLLLGFAWGCLLTPFTISTTAKGGYANASLIAMFAVAGVLFIMFTIWEWKFAVHPVMPRRILNKALFCSIAIDFGYYFSGYISDTYMSSWVYVIKDWSDKDYNYFLNILTVGLCLFSIPAGLVMKYTHRYKWVQIFGLIVRFVDLILVWSRILVSIGGGCSVISSQVAVQASVPHQDMAIASANLALWTQVGGSIGSAIAAAIWTNKLPYYLAQNLGGALNSTQIEEIYSSIVTARLAEPRDKVIDAYQSTMYYLLLPAFILSIVPIIAAIVTTNFYLDNKHNAIEDKVMEVRPAEETEDDALHRKVMEAEERARGELGMGRQV
ncbi:hypothetical protein JCM24511_05114 [Saitozyma sp. JCM 24511]|nr:hypothetical protein JCM24511_05114 [Saitozyma sp. JCM 24511]